MGRENDDTHECEWCLHNSRNLVTQKRSGLPVLPMHQQLSMTEKIFQAADAQGRVDVNPGVAGQGVGMINAICPAGDVLLSIASEAVAILERGIVEASSVK